jgi:hypothetical protein
MRMFFKSFAWRVLVALGWIGCGIALAPAGFRSGDKEAGALTICGFGLIALGVTRLVAVLRDRKKEPS